MNKRISGFTLVELVIVIAIIGILATIAYPSYLQHVRKGNRAAAQDYLLQLANLEEQYLFDARTYFDFNDAVAPAIPTDVSKYYNVTITLDTIAPAAQPDYTLTATPTGSQADDGTLVLNSIGRRDRTAGGVVEEW